MSFIKGLKGVTGIGLNAPERYQRAYEKGVLLNDYATAISQFEDAAAKYRESGDGANATRALANAAIYRFWSSKDWGAAREAVNHLRQLDRIETPGSRDEEMAAADLACEFEARMVELSAHSASKNPSEAQRLHRETGQCFQQLFGKELHTFKMLADDKQESSAEDRYFYHEGCAAYFGSLMTQYADPEAAAGELSKAASCFRQARNEEWRARCDEIQGRLRIKRTCWFCHRELQGLGLNVDYYPARITHYVRDLLERLDQDVSSLAPEGGSATVCVVCSTVIQRQADVYAAQAVSAYKAEVEPRLKQLSSAIERLSSEVQSLRYRSQ